MAEEMRSTKGDSVEARKNNSRADFSDGKLIVAGVLVGILVMFLWYWLPDYVARTSPGANRSIADAGQVGDKYGSVNALFSGLAFTALIVTILLQRRELQQNTRELATQADALNRQATLMQLSAALSALPPLIAQERARLQSADSELANEVISKVTTESIGEIVESRGTDLRKLKQSVQAGKDRYSAISAKTSATGTITTEDHEFQTNYINISSQARKVSASFPFLKRLHELMVEMEQAYTELKKPQKGESEETQLKN